jgi:hypothetical protein
MPSRQDQHATKPVTRMHMLEVVTMLTEDAIFDPRCRHVVIPIMLEVMRTIADGACSRDCFTCAQPFTMARRPVVFTLVTGIKSPAGNAYGALVCNDCAHAGKLETIGETVLGTFKDVGPSVIMKMP